MKREELTALGLAAEQVERIMAMNGADIERHKQTLDGERTRREALEGQLAQRDKDLETLKGQAGNSEALQKQLSELQGQYGTEKADWEKKLQETRMNSALEAQLLKAKARDTTAVKALLSMNKLTLKEDGTVNGLEEQLGALQKEKAWAFGESTRTSYTPTGGTPPDTELHFNFTGVRPQPKQ